MDQLKAARNGQLFKAAWQKSLEDTLKEELLEIAKKHTSAMYQEMNKRALEVVAQIQARLIMTQTNDLDTFSGRVTVQLLLPPEMQSNPPDGGKL
jgi:hypothetical protein